MPDATTDTCDTFIEFGCCNCYPQCLPGTPPDSLVTLERTIAKLRSVVAGMSDEKLEQLPAAERRLIAETRAHLAEYDCAKAGKGPSNG